MKNKTLEKLSYILMRFAKFFVKLAIYVVIIYLIGINLFNFGFRLFYEKSIDVGDGKEIVFEIKKNDTVDIIAENLKDAGLIDDTLAFKFRAKIYKTNFTPNTYNLNTKMTIKNMLDIFDEPAQSDIATTVESADVYQLSPEDDGNIEEETTNND